MNKPNETILNVLKWFVKTSRQYRDYSLEWYVVQKVFNRGMGCADLLRISPKDKRILVSENMARKSDLKRIVDLGLVLGAKTNDYSWKVEMVKVKMPNMYV